MNRIPLHISYLLLTSREVWVEGLGTFSAFYEAASFDSAEGLFFPSRIRIIFKDRSKENDLYKSDPLFLINSLKRKFKISQEEASAMVKEFVSSVKKRLEKHHYCRLDSIGYLFDNQGSLALKDTFWKKSYPSQFSSIKVS